MRAVEHIATVHAAWLVLYGAVAASALIWGVAFAVVLVQRRRQRVRQARTREAVAEMEGAWGLRPGDTLVLRVSEGDIVTRSDELTALMREFPGHLAVVLGSGRDPTAD